MTPKKDSGRNKYGIPLRWLRREDIIRAVEDDAYLLIDPFDKELARPNGGLDVRVGKLVSFREDAKSIDHDKDPTVEEDFEELTLRPGQSVLFLGLEHFTFPKDMMAICTLRSRYALRLIWPFGMGLVRLGWEGRLVFELANVSTHEVVTIKREDAIASLDIYQLDLP